MLLPCFPAGLPFPQPSPFTHSLAHSTLDLLRAQPVPGVAQDVVLYRGYYQSTAAHHSLVLPHSLGLLAWWEWQPW